MPIVLHKIVDAATEFAVWKIEEPAHLLYSKLQLDESEKSIYQSLSNGKRELHWLGSRVLLRTLINTQDFIKTGIDEHNKPFLVNFPHFFSLSHSFDYAAVMISQTDRVGIDIEEIKEKIERVVNKFLSEQEQAFIDSTQRIHHLYACWAAKEALYKMYGKKGLNFIEGITLDAFPYSTEGGVISARILMPDTPTPLNVNYFEFEGYMIAYVKE